MSKHSLKKRVRGLEYVSSPDRFQLMRITFHSSLVDGPYREVRFLSQEDGSKAGRFIRKLEPGELLEDVNGGMTPWHRKGDEDTEEMGE